MHCDTTPRLQEPIRDLARLDWQEVKKDAHYSVEALTQPRRAQEDPVPYGGQ
ncbi:MAG: hypothetical protein KGZ60_00205 [Truepera sp.]|nr:hypothetical protein [Truepera sp.]